MIGSADSGWWNRPCDRLDDYDAAVARQESGMAPTFADALRERCATCRGDLEPAQYGTTGRPWCHRCEPDAAPPKALCACGAVATGWTYHDGAVPYCADHGPKETNP